MSNNRSAIVLLASILFVTLITTALQAQKESNIYDSQGRLRVDTSFSISQSQLKRFIANEEKLFDCVLQKTEYNTLAHENSIEGLCIISFHIYQSGKPQDIVVELDQKAIIGNMAVKGLEGCTLGGLRGPGSKFYLPFRFRIDKESYVKTVEEGCALIQARRRLMMQIRSH